MNAHVRPNAFLFGLTLVVGCVFYPAVLYAIGRAAFPDQATGSLIEDKGSRLLARKFEAEEYFWPRPSAADYNAAAAGASNFGASNPKLRDRVCKQLGPMVVYKAGSHSAATGRTPQQDIEAWYAAKPELANEPHEAGIPATFFDRWLSDPANGEKGADLEPVIADMVTTSGSGLDPHITLRNALSVYQLDRVAKKRATKPGEIAELVRSQSYTPLAGLVGEPLVNVLELNLELDRRFPLPATPR
jgi:K+-transporting ATPase c subunit